MVGTLTEADIISSIQTENGCYLHKSTHIVETLIEIIKSALESGEDARYQDLENSRSKLKGTQGTESGYRYLIHEPRRVVTFKNSMMLRKLINDDR